MTGAGNKAGDPPRQVDVPPEAATEARRTLSIIWLVPIAAAAIGDRHHVTGHVAEGLEAGQTKVKYKDVEVGSVERIRFGEDLSNVVVTAKLDKEMEPYLTDSTRFWVVPTTMPNCGRNF